jgi:hypothetical protein
MLYGCGRSLTLEGRKRAGSRLCEGCTRRHFRQLATFADPASLPPVVNCTQCLDSDATPPVTWDLDFSPAMNYGAVPLTNNRSATAAIDTNRRDEVTVWYEYQDLSNWGQTTSFYAPDVILATPCTWVAEDTVIKSGQYHHGNNPPDPDADLLASWGAADDDDYNPSDWDDMWDAWQASTQDPDCGSIVLLPSLQPWFCTKTFRGMHGWIRIEDDPPILRLRMQWWATFMSTADPYDTFSGDFYMGGIASYVNHNVGLVPSGIGPPFANFNRDSIEDDIRPLFPGDTNSSGAHWNAPPSIMVWEKTLDCANDFRDGIATTLTLTQASANDNYWDYHSIQNIPNTVTITPQY